MNQHIFRGTEAECYLKYKEYCKKKTPTPTKKQIIQTPRIFHRERRAFHIGIEKGYQLFIPTVAVPILICNSDEYTSVKYIKVKDLEEEKQLLLEKELRDKTDKSRLIVIGNFYFYLMHYICIYIIYFSSYTYFQR